MQVGFFHAIRVNDTQWMSKKKSRGLNGCTVVNGQAVFRDIFLLFSSWRNFPRKFSFLSCHRPHPRSLTPSFALPYILNLSPYIKLVFVTLCLFFAWTTFLFFFQKNFPLFKLVCRSLSFSWLSRLYWLFQLYCILRNGTDFSLALAQCALIHRMQKEK